MNKKEKIIKAAAQLFAAQGYDATPTRQISSEAGVTEPLIYYYFKGKEELFTRILEYGFSTYFSCIDALAKDEALPFERLRKLIEFQFDIVEEIPDEMFLLVSVCPARLSDPSDICDKGLRKFRERLTMYLTDCLNAGIASGEFAPVPVVETAMLLFAFISGIVRYAAMHPGKKENLCRTAVDFCRRSLINRDVRGEPEFSSK